MWKRIQIRLLFIVSLLAMFGIGSATAFAVPSVSLLTDLGAPVGGQIVVPITITGVSDAGIGSYALRLDYDTAILSNPTAVDAGTLSEGNANLQTFSPPADGIGDFSVGIGFGFSPTEDGTLIKVQFDVSANFTGTTNITFASKNEKTVLSTAGFIKIESTFTDGSLLSIDDQGPITSNLAVSSNDISEGTALISLTGKIDDSAKGNNNINAAEYFVGAAGTSGSGTAMNAADDTFDSATEDVTASVDTSGWIVANSPYTLTVHGQDAQDNWGATQTVQVTVYTAPGAPVLSDITTPNNNQKPVFDWADVSGTATYTLEVSNSATYSPTVIQDTTLTNSTYTPTADFAEGTYYWRVRAVDAQAHAGAWTEGNIFITDITAPTVAIDAVTSPTDNTSQTVTGTMETNVTITAMSGTFAQIGAVSYPTTTTYSFEITSIVKGDNIITVTATDVASNTTSAQATIDYHPSIVVSPSGHIYVPVTVPGYTQNFSITGGSGTFTWELDTTAYGTFASGAGTSNIFTPIQDTPGDAVLTITDTVYVEKSSIQVNIHAVTFGLTPSEGGIVIEDTLALQVVGAVGTVEWTVNTPATGLLGSFTGDNNENAVFTGNVVGTTTITVTDGGAGGTAASVTSGTFEVVGSITVTSVNLAIADDITLQFNAVGGKGAQNSDYTWTVDPITAGTIDANGLFTPAAGDGVRTFKAIATDKTYTNISAQSVTVTVTDSIKINPAATTVFESASAAYTYTATGGSDEPNYLWTLSNTAAGTINATTGIFIPATVETGIQTTTIVATDRTFSYIFDEVTNVTVFGEISITKPDNYNENDQKTYPIVAGIGTTYNATAEGGPAGEEFAWSVKDTLHTTDTGNTFAVDADYLLNNYGAGVYTVIAAKSTGTPAEIKIRIPMRFVATKFAEADKKDSGNYNDTQGTDTYTIIGGPATSVYNYNAFNLNSVEVTDENCGSFTDVSPTDMDNVFNFKQGINAMASFKVKVALDKDQYDSDANVKRLVDAGLDTLWSGIFRVVPIVFYSGTVVDSDGAFIDDVMVVCTSDIDKIDATNVNGEFIITGFSNIGVTYKFFIQKDGYVDRIVTSNEIEAGDIVLESLGAGSDVIDGTVTLSDDAAPYKSGTVEIKVKTEAGDYIKDGSGNIITSLANPEDGEYRFPVPSYYADAASFTVEAKKTGYIFDEDAGLGVLTEVALGAENAHLTLRPVTIITVTGTAEDVEPDGTNDQVLVKITAEAGLAHDNFDETAAEIKVEDLDGNAVVPEPAYNGEDNSYSFTHDSYENFTITVYADVSEDVRDVDTDYKATKSWTYVKSATATATTVVANPNTTGGTASSGSGDTDVNLPPGGLTGDILSSVTIAIVEADASDAGATQITGSEIVEIVMTDATGDNVPNTDIQRIEITIKFDTSVVTEDALEAGTYVVYYASTMADMIAGNATAIPASQIILPVDYANGFVTFWVNHLSVFGIGSSSSSSSSADETSLSDSSNDSSCFIATAAYGSPFESHVKILRNFRDVYLLPNRIGHAFVDTYYKYSPKAAAFIADHESLRAVTRVVLMPVVGISYAALHTTTAQKMLITFLMVSFLAGGYLAVRRLKARKAVTV